jgi:hypothetical protein
MSLTEQILQLSRGEFWFFLGILSAASVAGFYFGFRWLSRARLIEDVPTARIRSAQQGYVELSGTARMMDGQPILAPLTGAECCWYRYKIEKRHDKNWRTVESDTSDDHFLLIDETGECLVDPEGAEVTPSDRSVWYGSSRFPTNRNPKRDRIFKVPLFGSSFHIRINTGLEMGSRYRYTEERIYPGDPCYALGLFKSLDDMDHHQNRRDMAARILRDWKQDRARMLARFDLNKDGEIDLKEWELARKAAATHADLEYRAQMERQVIHRLGTTNSRRHPFLLSTLPQFSLVRRYRFKGIAALAAFVTGGGGSLFMISQRLF